MVVVEHCLGIEAHAGILVRAGAGDRVGFAKGGVIVCAGVASVGVGDGDERAERVGVDPVAALDGRQAAEHFAQDRRAVGAVDVVRDFECRAAVVGDFAVAVIHEERGHAIDGLAGPAGERVVGVGGGVLGVRRRAQAVLLVELVAGAAQRRGRVAEQIAVRIVVERFSVDRRVLVEAVRRVAVGCGRRRVPEVGGVGHGVADAALIIVARIGEGSGRQLAGVGKSVGDLRQAAKGVVAVGGARTIGVGERGAARQRIVGILRQAGHRGGAGRCFGDVGHPVQLVIGVGVDVIVRIGDGGIVAVGIVGIFDRQPVRPCGGALTPRGVVLVGEGACRIGDGAPV